ncbi:hydrogenase iron-sulfur subunit [bacterium]|nr:hydrogenase iron-sulfur subunit [bacterium]
MSKIGVFISREGGDLEVLDLEGIAHRLEDELQEVDHVHLHDDINTVAGLEEMGRVAQEEALAYVVVGGGSLERGEATIKAALESKGINPHLVEVVNLKEMVAFVHEDKDEATEKAFQLLRTAVKRTQQGKPIESEHIRVEQQVLVVGGGVAGMTAALRLAKGGYGVVLVERAPSLGGRLVQLDRLWPRLDEAQGLARQLMLECHQSENIEVYAYSEVGSISGVPGNYEVDIHKKPRFVDKNKLEGLEKAMEALPKNIPDSYQEGLSMRAALYLPFPGAVPDDPLVDPDHIKGALSGATSLLEEGAIDPNEKEKVVHERVGAIILAVGSKRFDPSSLQHLNPSAEGSFSAEGFERILSSGGPTQGEILLGGKAPQSLVWLTDVGSDDPQKGVPYATEIPLMIAAKQAIMVKKNHPDCSCTVVYKDLRAHTRGYREFLRTAVEEYGVELIRGASSQVSPQAGGSVVVVHDILQGGERRLRANGVVLVTEAVPHDETAMLSELVQVGVDKSGFLKETHPALDPCATNNDGVFVAGDCTSPGDIRTAVISAEAAAAKALGVLGKKKGSPHKLILRSREESRYDRDCARVSPEQFEVTNEGTLSQRIRVAGEGGTESGASVPASPTRNVELRGWEMGKALAEIESLWSDGLGTIWKPRITGFATQFGGYPLLEMLGRERQGYSSSYRFLRVRSSAHLDPLLVLKTLLGGADGVLILAGPLGEGRFHQDNYLAMRRFRALEGVMDGAGIEPNRIKVAFMGPHQIRELRETLQEFSKGIQALGPLGFNE